MNPLRAGGFAEKVGSVFSVLVDSFSAARRGLFKRRERRLRLCETLALGEKRFLAVVSFKQQEFLVGGTSHSIALLTRLTGQEEDEVNRNSQE